MKTVLCAVKIKRLVSSYDLRFSLVFVISEKYHLIARSPQLFTHTVFNRLFKRVQLFANTEAEHVL